MSTQPNQPEYDASDMPIDPETGKANPTEAIDFMELLEPTEASLLVRAQRLRATDRVNSPSACPDKYRLATVADIRNPSIYGFYQERGAYWRKNGAIKTWVLGPLACRKFQSWMLSLQGGDPWNRRRHCTIHPNGHASVPIKFGQYMHDHFSHAEIGFHDMWVRIVP